MNSFEAVIIFNNFFQSCNYVYIIILQRDLSMFIVKNQCECLNESDSHPFTNCLDNSPAYLESDDDEQVGIDSPRFHL